MSAGDPFAPEPSRRRRDPGRTTGRLSSSTTLAAARALRAFLVAVAAISTGAQSLSAQGGMYYPYGSAVGPLYGYARRLRRVARARREPSSRPTREFSSDVPPLPPPLPRKRETRASSGPIVGVGPFGGVAPIGYTSGVSFGGAPRFFPGTIGGVGAVRGAVYRRDVRRGLRETRDDGEKKTPRTSNSLDCSETGNETLWDVVRATPELSMLRALLANDIPWVAAALDGKTLADGADPAAAFPPGEPYDADAPGLEPLVNERTGTFHVDTLFAPNDAAVDALRAYVLGEHGGSDVDPRAPAAARSPGNRENAARVAEPRTALEMLRAGNATAAALFVAYHVSPDVRLRIPELRRGALLRTALGGGARLMVDRVESAADDGYDDGPGGEVVVRGVGSQAGVIGGGVDACNGRVFVIDHVLLPVDVDGVTTPEQEAHAEAIRRAIKAEAGGDAKAPAAAESGD